MEAGKLRQVITLQTMDDDENWSDFFTCFAQANGLGGKEYSAESAEHAQTSVDFTIRYIDLLADLKPQTTRIIFLGNPYDVVFIDNFMFQNKSLKIRAVMNYGRQ